MHYNSSTKLSLRIIVFFALLILFSLANAASFASVKLNINRGHASKISVAIQVNSSEADKGIANEMLQIIKSDLKWSGLFSIISPQAFLEKPELNTFPNFSNWRKINAAALLVGKVYREKGEVRMDFRIWDPYAEKVLSSSSYSIDESSLRRVGHRAADALYSGITGDEGYFDSQLVFVAEHPGKAGRKIKQIAISDIDGSNLQYLTDGRKLALTPKMDPKGEKVAYLSYYSTIPHIFMLDLRTGVHTSLGKFPGISFTPRFSKDGTKLLMSIARAGSTSIYEMDTKRKNKLRRITFDLKTISTSPSYSPDDKQIVFNSDRNGSKQLYVIDASGKNMHKISSGDGAYASPVWSPRGDYIAFTKMKDGMFYIGVMKPDGSGERLLSSGWLEQGPSWSPNGRVIMFSKKAGGGQSSRLRVVDISGSGEREVRMSVDGSDPAWSKTLE